MSLLHMVKNWYNLVNEYTLKNKISLIISIVFSLTTHEGVTAPHRLVEPKGKDDAKNVPL